MAKSKAAAANAGTGEKKYMKPSEIVTFGIGLFGVALLTGWMPDYTMTFFADFAFKGKGFDSAQLATVVSTVFGMAGIVGAVCELIIGMLVDRTKTSLGKVKPWVGFGAIPLAIISMLVFVAPNTSSFTIATVWMFNFLLPSFSRSVRRSGSYHCCSCTYEAAYGSAAVQKCRGSGS